MGKILSGMIAVIFMAGGLTALTIGGAAADHGYGPHANTRCFADALNNPRVGNPARVRFRVGTFGNGRARGVVSFKYERRFSGFVVKQFNRRYRGSDWEKYAFRGIPRGKYVVRVFFDSNSAYKNDRTKFRQTVRPRREILTAETPLPRRGWGVSPL
jgi:hypothetical protein